jgi:hypothetical protein
MASLEEVREEQEYAKAASFSLPPTMINEIKDVASAHGISASAFAREALRKHLIDTAVVDGREVDTIVRLPGGNERPLVDLQPVLIQGGPSSGNRDNACFGAAHIVFWKALTPRMMGKLRPRFERLVLAIHVEEKRRRNGEPG